MPGDRGRCADVRARGASNPAARLRRNCALCDVASKDRRRPAGAEVVDGVGRTWIPRPHGAKVNALPRAVPGGLRRQVGSED